MDFFKKIIYPREAPVLVPVSRSNRARRTYSAKLPASHMASSRSSFHPLDVPQMLCSLSECVIGTCIVVDTPLMSLGIDSLSMVTYSTMLSSHFHIEISPTIVFDHPTLGSISSFICDFLSLQRHLLEAPTSQRLPTVDESRQTFLV